MKRYPLFWAVDLNLDGHDPSRGRRAAGRPGAGADAVERHGRRPELTGVPRLLLFGHQTTSRRHGKEEDDNAISPSNFARPERHTRLGSAAAHFGEIRNAKNATARAWFRGVFEATECDRGLRPL